MYRTVLVALDGSPLAEVALPYATHLARASMARLVLLRVVPAPSPAGTTTTEVDADMETRQAAEMYLGRLAAHLAADDHLLSVHALVIDGDAAPVIREQVRQQAADVLVMATRGRSGFGRWLYGSIADDVMRHTEVPVLLVTSACRRPWPADRRPRILVPLDGSALAEAAVDPATELATGLGADLLLLWVVEVPIPLVSPFDPTYARTPYDPSPARAGAERYLEGIATTLRHRGHSVSIRTAIGYPAQEIVHLAREQQVDVIAMATHGRTGVARLVLGSVATETLQRTDVPLLLIRPAALARAAGGGVTPVPAYSPEPSRR